MEKVITIHDYWDGPIADNWGTYEVRLKDIDGNEIVIVEFAALPNAAGSEFNQTGMEDWTAKTGQTSICGENDVFLIVIKFNNTICNDFGWMDIEKTSCNGYEVA